VVELLSKSQIDRLGEKLRTETYGEDELRLLDEYRRTFGPPYDEVVDRLEKVLDVPVSGRPAKSTNSIIEKLNRESIRLSQMQDIAGCRIVVPDIVQQNRTLAALTGEFSNGVVVDRRVKPSHGYRAVHFIVRDWDKPIEIQIRTSLQHIWAEMCEKLADRIDPSIKYGGGPEEARRLLERVGSLVEEMERLELLLATKGAAGDQIAQELRSAREDYVKSISSIFKEFTDGAGDAG